MVHFMGSSNAFCVPIISISEYFETLVDKNIVHKKIGKSISKNAQTNGQSSPKTEIAPTHKTAYTHHCIKNKEVIITFPPTAVIFVMMVFVNLPQETVHNVFMCKPRHKFHNAKSGYEN